MPDAAGTLEILARELGLALAPLEARLSEEGPDALFESLGLRLPAGFSSVGELADSLVEGAGHAVDLPVLVADLLAAIEADDSDRIVSLGIETADKIVLAIQSIVRMAQAVDSVGSSFGGLSAADRAAITAFAEALPERLLNTLLVDHIEARSPQALSTLVLAGVIDYAEQSGDETNPLLPAYVRKSIRPDRAVELLSDPLAHFQSVYRWGAPDFDGLPLFDNIKRFLEQQFDLPVELLTPAGLPAVLEAYVVAFKVDDSVSPPGLTVDLRFPATQDIARSYPFGEGWELTVDASARFAADAALTLEPPFELALRPPSGSVEAELDLSLGRTPGSQPLVLLGRTDGSRLQAGDVRGSLGARASWDSASGRAGLGPVVRAGVADGYVLIDLSDGDGFIQDILSGVRVEGNFDLAARWTGGEGVEFEGSGGIEIALPTHIDLGPLSFDTLYLVGTLFDDVPLKLEISSALNANLGPLAASVDRIGAIARLDFPGDQGGNLGPLDLSFAFKPPNGIGLSIDAAVVKGGGYLYLDFEKEEYAGALELVFSEFLTLKAIGLVTTRLPDGSEGFSLLVIITAEFGSPIQLGFGFTLNGVGGLLGLNRTMRLEVLAEGVRSGAVESVMFPTDVIANAPRIISDLRAFFPPQQDIFLIGPMAKLGWGTPSLVTAQLGVVIEIPPGNIAILGVLKVALPDEDAALIVLQVNFVGAMEFDKQRIWFFASMFESRVLFLTIEGEMGLLSAWGTDANFVLSVGGFHPQFDPPPLPFPNPKRIAVNILNESFARVRVEGYFAVTSNTAQFGARAALFFGLSEFRIEGHIAFDALFQFSPFYFIISVSASLDVKVFGIGLFSVRMRGELEGTSPWHIEGEGSISILFFDVDVPFSHTWGQDEDTTLPPVEVMPLLEAEFNKLENWTAQTPAANSLLVSLREIETTEDLVLHPVGVLRVSQRAVPLDLTLDKVGNRTPSDVRKVNVVVQGSGLAKHDDAEEQFATAQFKNLSDSRKLSTPPYEKQIAGVELSVDEQQFNSDAAVKRVVRYEEIIIDTNFREHVKHFVAFALNLFTHFLRGNAASRASLSAAYKTQKSPFEQKIAVVSPEFVVASSVDNTAFGGQAVFTSQAKAEEFRRELVDGDPALVDALHVIPASETRQAA